MTTMPSNTIKDLLRQGKQDQAMKLYRQEGVTGTDINYLNTAYNPAAAASPDFMAVIGRRERNAVPPSQIR